ncbi:hypothetical protein Ndes2526B_g00583 [Nannochloris sp. 'desiccata']|nr:hypothetical protein KSW81_003887 [Chlorella desiccata (nom. nud.)]KAH7624391.1 hypothetical protein NADE_003743 [Chlorella desiccata (nom. nud.)]
MAGKQSNANKKRSLAVLNLAAIVERCDEQILPAVFFFLGRSLHASLPDLGMLTLSRALVQALASPLSGILGTTLNRTFIVALGCILWGTMTSAIGLCTTLTQAMAACALNGLGLALVVPTLSSLVADSTSVGVRGKAFGAMGLTASLGGMAGALFATNVGATSGFWGVAGWRWAFHAVAAVAFLTAWLVHKYALDPGFLNKKEIFSRDSGQAGGGSHDARYTDQQVGEMDEGELLLSKNITPIHSNSNSDIYFSAATTSNKSRNSVWQSIYSILRIPSFQVIVLQGIVGSIPWQAMAMMTLWLQLLNFSNFQSSVLTAIFTLGCAVGNLLGGTLGDAAARKAPAQGRIYVCQASVFLAMPLSWLLFKGLAVPRSAPPFSIDLSTRNSTSILTSTFSDGVVVNNTNSSATFMTTKALPTEKSAADNFENNLEKENNLPLLSSYLHHHHQQQHSSSSASVLLLYAFVLLITGLSISWCGCNNSALFSELVPENQRTHVYAFDRSFEGALGACGAPLVGIAAERLFGFQGSMSEAAVSVAAQEMAARALSSALLLCLVGPWSLCLLSYTLLHWTYPKDRMLAMKALRKSGSEGGSLLRLVEDGHSAGGGGGGSGGGGGAAVVRQKRPPSA